MRLFTFSTIFTLTIYIITIPFLYSEILRPEDFPETEGYSSTINYTGTASYEAPRVLILIYRESNMRLEIDIRDGVNVPLSISISGRGEVPFTHNIFSNYLDKLIIIGSNYNDVININTALIKRIVCYTLNGDDTVLDRDWSYAMWPPPMLEIHGGIGNDTIFGRDGPDILCGDDGNDIIVGREGDDCLFGGNGNDTLIGYEGNDKLDGGPGNDTLDPFSFTFRDPTRPDPTEEISVSSGDETLGNDTLLCGAGNDSAQGGGGDNVLIGEDGNDTLTGGEGQDYLLGGPGNDTLDGGDGMDHLRGGDGDDILGRWGDGPCELYGGPGRDTLLGGSWDYLNGGIGSDYLYTSGVGIMVISDTSDIIESR